MKVMKCMKVMKMIFECRALVLLCSARGFVPGGSSVRDVCKSREGYPNACKGRCDASEFGTYMVVQLLQYRLCFNLNHV